MIKKCTAAVSSALMIGTPCLAQDNQHYAELITDCTMLGIADRNAPFSEPMPLSELQNTAVYSQMINGMAQALDGLDEARDKEGAISLIEKMLAGMPDGDIPLECFRNILLLKDAAQ